MANVKGSISVDEIKVYAVDGDPSSSFVGATAVNGDMALQDDGTNGNVYVYDQNAWKRLGASGEIDLYNGTTRVQTGIRMYLNSATTNAQGRCTFNLTSTGAVGGTNLFSSILTIQALGLDGSGTAIQAPLFFIESQSASQVVVRAVRGTSTGVLIGGTVVSMQFVGAGYTCRFMAIGLK